MKLRKQLENNSDLIKGGFAGIIVNSAIGALSIAGFFTLFGEKIGFAFAWFYYVLPNSVLLKNCLGENCWGYAVSLSVLCMIILGALLGIIIKLIMRKVKQTP